MISRNETRIQSAIIIVKTKKEKYREISVEPQYRVVSNKKPKSDAENVSHFFDTMFGPAIGRRGNARGGGGLGGRQTGNGPKKIFLRFCVSKTRSRSPGPRPFSPGPKRINYVRGPSRLFRNSVKYSARVVWGRPNTHTLGGGQEQRPKINTYEIYQSRDNGGGRVGTRTDD